MKRLNKNSGQAIMSEYVVLIFLVVAAIVAISVYVQRSMQAKTFDVRNYMVRTIEREGNVEVLDEYEPYYGNVDTKTARNVRNDTALKQGGITGVYEKIIQEAVKVDSVSKQLPPREAGEVE